MHAHAQLQADQLAFSYGPRTILSGVSLTVAPGDRIGLVGPNGSGKSTLLAVLAGELISDSGRLAMRPPDARVGLVHQQLRDQPGETVMDYLRRVSQVDQISAEFDDAVHALASEAAGADERYDRALTAYLAADVAGFEANAQTILAQVGLPPSCAEQLTRELSGGQRTKVNLASIMLAQVDVLLLDEPTNDLDSAGLQLLEDQLLADQRGVVIVSHDRAFLDTVTTAIFELDPYTLRGTRYNGGFSAWQHEREVARQREYLAYDEYNAKRNELRQRARKQQKWSSQGAKRARNDKSEADKFIRAKRIADSEKVASKAKQTERALERLERNEHVDAPWEPWELQLSFAAASRPGQLVAELTHATVERGSFTLGPVSVTVEAGDRLLITGENGSGKTTLLDALFGWLPVSGGAQRVGPSTRVATLRQSREIFADAKTVLGGFVDATGLDDAAARSQLAKLGLNAGLIGGPVVALSPGEQTRVALACFAAQEANVLVLDEPTNHLDLQAIEQLEAAVAAFPHTVVLVTHDRRLIENVVTDRHWHLDEGIVVER